MKLFTPEISWHQKEPIFSVDFCPKTWKLASCGADFTVKIWQVKEKSEDDASIGIEFLANLDRHAKPVNVVRFSPNGKFLASAGDDGTIILWKLSDADKSGGDLFDDDDAMNKETWVVHKMLRGHVEDVYDLAWSPDSAQLISGSVDNSAIIWDAIKGQNLKILTDHKHYVQGVCWDPRGFYVATHSSDRSCRLYQTSTHKCVHNIHKNTSSYKKDEQMINSKLSKMFLDETMQSFFRRCAFSPDGSFLFLPAGMCDGDTKSRKTTYVFARGHFKCPVRHLPGSKKPTVAIKCSPIIYEIKDDKENTIPFKENNEFFKLPYRMIYAVASLDSVTFYDTQHEYPIGHCANMHYASLTDITWSSDGKLIVISSTDGYCSFIKFDEDEFGTPITYDAIEYQVTQAKIRKAQKSKSKKKESKKVVVTNIDTESENTLEKVTTTPVSKSENKEKHPKSNEKISKSIDRNQPTIEKLFVTPVRKRKRPSSGNSPAIEVKKTPSSVTAVCTTPKRDMLGVTIDMTSPSSAISLVPSPLLSPSRSTETKLKPPKRAQVVTLSTTTSNKETSSNFISPTSAKPAKRANVTTLVTFKDSAITDKMTAANRTPTKSENSAATNAPADKTSESKLTQKVPKRVAVTTIKTFQEGKKIPGKDKLAAEPISSSVKTSVKAPKRVQVTTLTTFNDKATSSSTTKSDKSTGIKNDNTKATTSEAQIEKIESVESESDEKDTAKKNITVICID